MRQEAGAALQFTPSTKPQLGHSEPQAEDKNGERKLPMIIKNMRSPPKLRALILTG
jgi:hypothetical protein